MIRTQRDNGCQLKATRAVMEWCTIPTGLNTTELKDDFISFPQHTKCALKMDNTSIVCKGCYENRWYETSCNHGKYTHVYSIASIPDLLHYGVSTVAVGFA
ncbi:hypothetical protein SNE40_006162 [Patella caerulea]|uniref:Uncharacterized protein n=1 Tax=Patella caerulea TaxID=87958 RepID=A0AAN8JW99_PATCE